MINNYLASTVLASQLVWTRNQPQPGIINASVALKGSITARILPKGTIVSTVEA